VVPSANTLFQRAISQSSVLETTSIAVAQNYKDDASAPGADTSSGELLLQLLINDGQALERITAKMVAATMTPSAIAAYLRSKTFVELNTAYTQLIPLQLTRPFIEIAPQLVRDGTVIPSGGINAAIRAGNYAHVPVILGTNRDEYTALLSVVGIPTFLLPNPLTGQGLILDKSNYLLSAEYLTRLMKANSVDDLAALLQAHQPGQVFTYRFDWDVLLPSPMLDNIQMGATHGLEVPFVFQQLDLGPEFTRLTTIMKPEGIPSYVDLSNTMQSYWTQFATTGDPGQGRAGNLPHWDAWASAGNKSFMFLDEPAGGGVRMSTAVETRAQVLHALENDSRTGMTTFNRCGFAANLWSLRSGARITKSEYANLFNGFCQLLMPLPNYNIQGDRDSALSP
jgi:para-nitrobenzyl esterase